MAMYEVSIHHYGRKRITSGGINNPTLGLLEWPKHVWGRITPRPIGIARAKALADAQQTHAAVAVWMTCEKVYDNGKPALVPEGWYPPEQQY